MQDIQNRKDIELIVDSFYKCLLKDVAGVTDSINAGERENKISKKLL